MRMPLIILLSSMILFVSCDDEENKEERPQSTANPIEGLWQVNQMTCFCPGYAYDTDEYTWDIDLSTQELIVTKNLPDSIYIIYEVDTYEISDFNDQTNELSIQLDSFDQTWDFILIGDSLTLSDNPQLDGPILNLSRIQ